ncbi:NAD-dependent epimerase/dehydratase family protein [Peloplasma aerotolerans]|uniref:NAD-dependent epimerase/dehydratase family protein n=1 Tax=Peloplasma aerotolerans TaxID=3044389 RepID=A0AAW6U6P9_9MOLU|nr:NAD-dependent epimerase/dehydratase family protein [Mariniplasma sp. M4Ah]MDI6453638.1 NAD-dependent epimerase/dehydratase family protein [Mariniplasma sp. M4Ah]
MSRIYIVTGANGHLGNTIVRMLRNQNQIVRGFILPNDSKKMLKSLGVEIFCGDVRNVNQLEPLFQDISTSEIIVIHTAGIVSISSKMKPIIHDVNVNGTKNIVDLCLKYKVSKLVHVSSVHAIPEKKNNEMMTEISDFNPDLVIGGYAKSKSIASQYVLDSVKKGVNAIIVHPSGIIGPNDYGRSHMTMMIEDYLNGHLTSRINGAYDFVDVRDVASGIIQASVSGQIGNCYILSGHRVTLSELFEQLRKISGKKRHIHVLPMWFAKVTAPLAEFYYKLRKLPPIYTSYSLYTISSNSYFSHQLAHVDLNYTPRSMDDTIYDTVKWLVKVKRIKRTNVIDYIKTFKTFKKKTE